MKFYAELNDRQASKIARALPRGLKNDHLDESVRSAMLDFGLNLPTRDDGSVVANKMLDRCERNVSAIIRAYARL